MGNMDTVRDDFSNECSAFTDLLVEAGLVTGHELAVATHERSHSGGPIDEILVAHGVIKPAVLRTMLARAWNLPAIDLARTHVDHELVDQWSDDLYLGENWFPVRDQANGTVLVATSRRPDIDRAERIAALIEAPVEFAVVASGDITAAVARAVKRRSRVRRGFLR
jgi:hypothetical protein